MLSVENHASLKVEGPASPHRRKKRLISDSGEEGSFLLHAGALTPHDPGGGLKSRGSRKGQSQPCSPRLRHESPRSRSRSESVPAMGITYQNRIHNSPEPRPRSRHKSMQGGSEAHRSIRDTKPRRNDVTYNHTGNTDNRQLSVPASAQTTKEDLALEAVMMESSKHLESVTRIVQQSFTQSNKAPSYPPNASLSTFDTPPTSQPAVPDHFVHHYHNVSQKHYYQTHHHHYHYHPSYHSAQNHQHPSHNGLPHRFYDNYDSEQSKESISLNQPGQIPVDSVDYTPLKNTSQRTKPHSDSMKSVMSTKNGPRTHKSLGAAVPYRHANVSLDPNDIALYEHMKAKMDKRKSLNTKEDLHKHIYGGLNPTPKGYIKPSYCKNKMPTNTPTQCLSAGVVPLTKISVPPHTSGATLSVPKIAAVVPYGYSSEDYTSKPFLLKQMMKEYDETIKHINKKDHGHVIKRTASTPSGQYKTWCPPSSRHKISGRPRMSCDTISLDDMSTDTCNSHGSHGTSRTTTSRTSTMDCGSLDTILRQLEQERIRMERQRNRLRQVSGLPPFDRLHPQISVPLAEPEQFQDDCASLLIRDGSATSGSGAGVSSSVVVGGNTLDDCDHVSSIECLSVEEDVFMCSPDVSSGDDVSAGRQNTSHNTALRLDLLTDVNGNGTARSRSVLSNRKFDQLEMTETESSDDEDSGDQREYDMAAFAEKYFNVHTSQTSGYGTALSNIVRRRSLSEIIPMQDLCRYTKSSSIPTSHIQLHSPELTQHSCAMFKDLCRLLRADVKSDAANQVIRNFIAMCQRYVELRDEAYCLLMRQTTCNPSRDSCLRAWILLCLCCISFRCSRTLKKYLLCYLRKSSSDSDVKITRYASYCLQNYKKKRLSHRRMPPSAMEIECIRSSLPMVTRVHFLDGTTKAVGSDINATAADILKIIKDKTGLISIHGWALYENSPDNDRFIRSYEYLADIISDWEENQRASYNTSTPRRCSPRARKLPSPQNYGKILFCRRVFSPHIEISDDPMQYHLLYSQAVHNVVQVDEFSVSEGMALHLAGIQAQVIHGDFNRQKKKRYADVDQYICQRILLDNDPKDWTDEIADAHQRYGDNKSTSDAEMYYLSVVSSFPFYGAMKFFAHYQGLWLYGIEFIIAISHADVKFISVQDKMVLYDYPYNDIEFIQLDFESNLLILQLKTSVQGRQKSYMFECLDLEDIATILEVYAPQHVTWKPLENRPYKNKWKVSDRDWLGQYESLIRCRKQLVDSNLILKPAEQPSGFIKSTIKKIQGSSSHPGESLPCLEGLHLSGGFWSYSRQPFTQPLMALGNEELTDIAVRLFNSTLIYTGIETTDIKGLDIIEVLQTLISKCMESADLCNEFYLQVTKQTTDVTKQDYHTSGVAYWHLLLMVTCIVLPAHPLILDYIIIHLKRHALHQHTEHGSFAQFAIQCLHRTYESKGRMFPPSYQEICAVTNRQKIELLICLPDGHQIFIEFHSASTIGEILDQIKMKIGARLDAEGFAVFRVHDEKEAEDYLPPNEKIADYLYKTEKWLKKNDLSHQDIKYVFKKRVFVEPYMNLCDPVEVDLLYHQSVSDVFEGVIPLTKDDTIQICALRAQTEYGNYGIANNFDYSSVMRILPRHLRELIHIPDISVVHKTLHGVSPMAANIKFLDVVRHWPLYGARFYEVTQSHSDDLPDKLWLAISQLGVHLMEHRRQTIYTTYVYKEIHCQSSLKNLTITIHTKDPTKDVILNTTESPEIIELITDYRSVLDSRSPINESTPAYDDSEIQLFDQAEETRL